MEGDVDDVGHHVQARVVGRHRRRGGLTEHVGVERAVDVDAEPGLAVRPREPHLALSTGLLGDADDLEQAGDVGL